MKMKFTHMIAALLTLLHTTLQVWADGPNFTNTVEIANDKPLLVLRDTDQDATRWDLENDWACTDCFSIWHSKPLFPSHRPFIIEQGSDNNLLYLDSENRIGINTNVPGATVDVLGTNIRLRNNSAVNAPEVQLSSSLLGPTLSSTNDTLFILTSTNEDIIMNPEGGLFSWTGKVGIGTTTPEAKLDVKGGIRSFFKGENTGGDGLSNTVTLSANNSAAGKGSDVGFALLNDVANFQWNFRTFQGTEGFAATKQGTGGAEMVIQNSSNDYRNVSIQMGNGAKLSSNGNWLNASSREYKEDIYNISVDEAMEVLKTITPVKYHYKRDVNNELKLGFIAEDVPDLVASRGRKNMDAMEVVAMLTKVVQEQQRELEHQLKTITAQRSMADEQQKLTAQLLAEMSDIKRMVKSHNMVVTAERFN